MNMLSIAMPRFLKKFVREESGSQVIEYALIIAVVSLVLVAALQGLTGTSFSGFITKVQTCLSSGVCSAPAAVTPPAA